MRLEVLAYNILADAYVKAERYPNSPPEALRPDLRRSLLLDTIAMADADLYCLQEVEPDAFEAIRARLEHHDGHLDSRSDRPDGLALFWRRTLPAPTLSTITDPSLGAGNTLVAQIADFDLPLRIANTHLRWRPERTPDHEHTGLLQLRRILEGVDSQTPTILAGDFNANSQSRVVAEAESRGLMISCRSQRPWDTTNINGRRRKIDYLLHTPDRLRPEPGRLPKLERFTPMPSAMFASDHLPLQVGFTLK